MSPVNPHVVNQLRQLIYYHLDCNLLRNALFLAGRLHAYEPRSSEAGYLLGLCHLRLGQIKAAYDASKQSGSRGTHLGCSYVYAQACLGLERYIEGITALDKSRGLWAARNSWNKHSDSRRQHLPDAAAVLCLQGKLWHAHEDTNRAIDCYAEALKLNPFMWDAFLGLCDIGVNVRIPNIFKMTPEMMTVLAAPLNDEVSLAIPDEIPPSNGPLQTQISNSNNIQLPSNHDPFSISKNRTNTDATLSFGSSALFEKLNGSTIAVTPVAGGGGIDLDALESPPGFSDSIDRYILAGKDTGTGAVVGGPITTEPPHAPVRRARTLQGIGMDFSVDAPPKMRANSVRSKARSKGVSEEADAATVNRLLMLNTGRDQRKRTISGQAAPPVPTAPTTNLSTHAEDPSAPQRRSVRLFNQIRPASSKFSSSTGTLSLKEGRELKKAKATGTKGRSANPATVGRVVSGNRKHGDPMDLDNKEPRATTNAVEVPQPTNQKPAVSDKVKQYESLQTLLDLLKSLGSGYFALSHYQCQDAIQIFNSNSIIPSQRETPWVLAQIGRALYEQANYAEAEIYFARIRTMAPSRLEDMEVYSTILWHLKRDIDLAYLAHELIDIDRLSPPSWCALGNSFSLQRDHDQALKCFKRATQLDPTFAYAFTLQGHEHVANEEFDKALSAYRHAIAADARHYNAWYGLGRVFEKQGKYDVAEQHYRTAAGINPTNSVLLCCIGVVLEKLKNPKAALLMYTRACELAPRSRHSLFKKAEVLLAAKDFGLALVELTVLNEIAPDEANVQFMLGKAYKGLRRRGEAVRHFTAALNLDPKASHYIKEVMEQMEDDGDEPDEMQMQ
ncbi:MAG: bimA [Lasallia pustulata]|uniref:BimA n=1 Tax=Lasallia pustulata TaxID=136370 RepID=A0A5M8PR60_9LECA|nr:MAG: bimA [Lasallia pustulata]